MYAQCVELFYLHNIHYCEENTSRYHIIGLLFKCSIDTTPTFIRSLCNSSVTSFFGVTGRIYNGQRWSMHLDESLVHSRAQYEPLWARYLAEGYLGNALKEFWHHPLHKNTIFENDYFKKERATAK